MTETMVTLVGNVATGVEFKESPTGGVARFRFAVPVRRWDRARADWTDGPTSFYTVWAWRTLAANLAASVSVGEPLVVQGRLRVREEDREGGRRTFVDIEAAAAGHDLTRGTSAFRRVARGVPRVTPNQGEVVAGLLAKASVGQGQGQGQGQGEGQGQDRDPWAAPAPARERTGPWAGTPEPVRPGDGREAGRTAEDTQDERDPAGAGDVTGDGTAAGVAGRADPVQGPVAEPPVRRAVGRKKTAAPTPS
ncbi:single-stranded DNA-binding protein [Streptomyces sp. NBC_01497]|uniref:single-stranded DNA-binding protein n=1 Tax=Streptomyces sp. NBC_01497 TaxID=2903885 RepID=UPI002E3314FB|nr:single-stranded DNA-binding protein [Streptomyces sp. NBC_01497]